MLKKLFVTILICSLSFFLFANQIDNSSKREAIKALNAFEKLWKEKLIKKIKEDSRGVKAIHYCADNILRLTKEFSSKYKNITIRRTSLKYRDPEDAPDKRDRQVLMAFDKMVKMRKKPEIRIIKTKREYRIYKPLIITEPICLKCHGTKKRLHPEINRVLDKKYPNDKAINFKYKNVRGAIVATIKREEK